MFKLLIVNMQNVVLWSEYYMASPTASQIEKLYSWSRQRFKSSVKVEVEVEDPKSYARIG